MLLQPYLCAQVDSKCLLPRAAWLQAARPASSAGPPVHGAASTAANQPFWASWGKQLNDASTNFSKGTQDWWAKSTAGGGKGFKMPKWEMPGAPHQQPSLLL